MHKDLLLNLAKEIMEHAGFPVDAEWMDDRIPRLRVTSSEDISLLIGKQGQNVGAIEHLIRLMAHKKLPRDEQLPDFMFDINDFRKAQTEELIGLAHASAQRVTESGRAESLSPMNAFERKVVHTELATHGNLETQSIGTEPNRRVVIKRASI